MNTQTHTCTYIPTTFSSINSQIFISIILKKLAQRMGHPLPNPNHKDKGGGGSKLATGDKCSLVYGEMICDERHMKRSRRSGRI